MENGYIYIELIIWNDLPQRLSISIFIPETGPYSTIKSWKKIEI